MQRRTLFAALAAAAISIQPLSADPKRSKTDVKEDELVSSVSTSNNGFALSLYGELRKKEEGNIFFSPLSISLALGMTYGGARGDTAAEMASALQLKLAGEQHLAWQLLQAHLTQSAKGNYQLSIANKLWAEKLFEEAFLQSFFDLTQKFYGAPVELLRFEDAEAAAGKINDWVKDNTKEKIKKIISPDIFVAPDPVSMVLTNAIYFKGNWANQFLKESTQNEAFFLSAKESIQTSMMFQKSTFRYAEDVDSQILAMPYQGDSLEMLVILPTKKDGLAGIEKALSAKKLNDWLARMSPEEVLVKLPKFKLESSYSLVKPLKAMGMKAAFGGADFSGIADMKKLSEIMKDEARLYISNILHKGFVEVNEEGSEAAAVTAVIINVAAGSEKPSQAKTFTADHPFLFMIRDMKSGAILFMGRLQRP